MIEDTKELGTYFQKYPICSRILQIQAEFNNEGAFCELIQNKCVIPKELYATMLTILYQADTCDVKKSTLLRAFSGINRKELMTSNDMVKFEALPEKIDIYRGVQNLATDEPRLSWSLKKDVAKRYARPYLFYARINKKDVIAYYSENCDEEEVLVHLVNEFTKEKIY